jgi:phosphoglycerate dehydrogenase-like enzyme
VSCHAPLVDDTRGLVTGAHLAAMKTGATFVNTARGAVVRESELVEVLAGRPDLEAVLDVTDPEPPAPGSPLYTLPNVVLTPHIAGSVGHERRRLGSAIVEELRNYVSGLPLRWEVTRERALAMGAP